MICSKQCACFGQTKSVFIVFLNQPNCREGSQEAVKHRQIRVDLAGNAQGRAILAQFKVVENVERCPGVKNLAAPASKNEVDDMVEGSRHRASPVLRFTVTYISRDVSVACRICRPLW